MKKKKLFMLSFIISLFLTVAFPTHAANLWSLVSSNPVENFVDQNLNPLQENTLGIFFGIWSSSLMMLAGIIAAYTLIAGTMATAHDGEIVGKKWSSMWLPIRTAIGTSLILPVSGGYNISQVILLWLVLQGSDLGDNAWKAAAPSLITDNSFISISNKEMIRENISNIMFSAACVNVYNTYIQNNNNKMASDSRYSFIPPDTELMSAKKYSSSPILGDDQIGWKFGLDSKWPSKGEACGSIKLALIDKNSTKESESMLVNTNEISKTVEKAQIAANDAVVLAATAYAKSHFVYMRQDLEPSPEELNKTIDLMVNVYAQTVQLSADAVLKKSLSQSQIDKLTEKGWMYSYAFYNRIAQAMSAGNTSTNRFPTATPNFSSNSMRMAFSAQSNVNDTSSPFAYLERIRGILKMSDYYHSPSSDPTDSGESTIEQVISSISGNMGLTNSLEESRGSSLQPLTVATNLGTRLIEGSGAAWTVVAGIAAAGGAVPVAGGGVQSLMTWMTPMANGIISKALITGNILAFVMPSTPMFIGFFCAAAYFIMIIEAMVGVPLLVVALFLPDQDGIVGKQGQGYMLVLNVYLRPLLNVYGFISSFIATNACFKIMNDMFFTGMDDIHTGYGWLGLNQALTTIIMYCSLMMVLELTCLKLMHLVPDKVLAWIGGGTSAILGSVSSMAEGSHGRMSSAIAAGMGATAGSMMNVPTPRGGRPSPPPAPPTEGTASEGTNGSSEESKAPEAKGDSGQDIKDS